MGTNRRAPTLNPVYEGTAPLAQTTLATDNEDDSPAHSSQWEHVGIGTLTENPAYGLVLSSETDGADCSATTVTSPQARQRPPPLFVRSQTSNRGLHVAIGVAIVALLLAAAALVMASRSKSESSSSGSDGSTAASTAAGMLSALASLEANSVRQEARLNHTQEMLDAMSMQHAAVALQLNATQHQLARVTSQHAAMALQLNTTEQMLATASVQRAEMAQQLKRTEEQLAAAETQRTSLVSHLAAVEANGTATRTLLISTVLELSRVRADTTALTSALADLDSDVQMLAAATEQPLSATSFEARYIAGATNTGGNYATLSGSSGAILCALARVDDDTPVGSCLVMTPQAGSSLWRYRLGAGPGDQACAFVCLFLA